MTHLCFCQNIATVYCCECNYYNDKIVFYCDICDQKEHSSRYAALHKRRFIQANLLHHLQFSNYLDVINKMTKEQLLNAFKIERDEHCIFQYRLIDDECTINTNAINNNLLNRKPLVGFVGSTGTGKSYLIGVLTYMTGVYVSPLCAEAGSMGIITDDITCYNSRDFCFLEYGGKNGGNNLLGDTLIHTKDSFYCKVFFPLLYTYCNILVYTVRVSICKFCMQEIKELFTILKNLPKDISNKPKLLIVFNFVNICNFTVYATNDVFTQKVSNVYSDIFNKLKEYFSNVTLIQVCDGNVDFGFHIENLENLNNHLNDLANEFSNCIDYKLADNIKTSFENLSRNFLKNNNIVKS